MMVVRPVTASDLDALERLVVEAGDGMTTLPKDRTLLEQRVNESLRSFREPIDSPGEESYWFVMADTEARAVVGLCAIYARIGLSRPFYSFKVIHLTHTSQELDHYEPVRALQMVDEYRGSTEIGSLYLTPEYRRDGNGRMLSRSRFLFIAEFAERFADRVFAEMRGTQDEHGHSVFWDNLGRHFIKMSFSKADYLSSLGKYQFIADMMPKYPVYVRLLPEEAREAIGQVHESTRPALELLKREGFRFEGCIDVFDAGPTIVCPTAEIHTVRDSRRARVGALSETTGSDEFMVSNTSLGGFTCIRTSLLDHGDDAVSLHPEAARILAVGEGDHIRYVQA